MPFADVNGQKLYFTDSGSDGDTHARAWVEEEIAGFTGLLDALVAGGWSDDLVTMFYGLLFGPGFDDPYWSGKWRSRPPEAVIPAWECLRDRDDVTDRLGEIACPALIVHGEADAGIAIEDGRALEAGLPNVVDFCAVPGAGHTPNVERPDIVNPAIRSFLAGLD